MALQAKDVTVGMTVGEKLNSFKYSDVPGHVSTYACMTRRILRYFIVDHLSFNLALNVSILVGTGHNSLAGRCMLLGGTYVGIIQ